MDSRPLNSPPTHSPPPPQQCLPWMLGLIKSLSAGHPVAEIFLIGFAFAYLVEGARWG